MWAFLSGTVTFLDGAVNHCLSTLQQIPCLVSQGSGGASGCRHPEMTLTWGWEAGRLNEPGRWPSISQTHVGPNFSQSRGVHYPFHSPPNISTSPASFPSNPHSQTMKSCPLPGQGQPTRPPSHQSPPSPFLPPTCHSALSLKFPSSGSLSSPL